MEAGEGSPSRRAPGAEKSARPDGAPKPEAAPRPDAPPRPGAPPPSEAEKAEDFPAPVAHFLRVLATAVQKFTMYPPGHPALQATAESVLEPLAEALRERPLLSIGIGSRQLAFEGVDSDPDHPRHSFLAGRLHRHQLASITFSAGISRRELESFLGHVSVEADRCERPLGGTPPDELPVWPHVRLQPIRYEKLGMAEAPVTSDSPETRSAPRSRRLWLGFARLALVREALKGDSDPHESHEAGPAAPPPGSNGPDARRPFPEETAAGAATGEDETESLARALEELSTETGYAEEVLTRLVEISKELRSAHEADTEELRQRTSRLVSLVSPDALRRVLREGGHASERRQLLLDASQWMEPNSVVKLVRATAGVEKQDISHWLLLMMSKLAQHAASGSERVRVEAETTLRDQVAQLVTDWALEDAVPEEYGAVLERMSRSAKGVGGAAAAASGVEPERVLMLGLELDARGKLVLAAAEEMLETARFAELFDLLERSPPGSEAAHAIWERVARPETMARILAAEEPDFDAVDRLLARSGSRVAAPMLDTLANSASRSMRRKLFSRLARSGPEIGPQVVRWLEDGRWFVLRNMLALMGELEEWPRKWSPASYAEHPHPGVRREALKLMLRLPECQDMAVVALLEDDDPRSLALGLAAAQDSPPLEAMPLLLGLVEQAGLPPELRAQAVRALVWHRTPQTRAVLLRLIRQQGGFLARLFGRWRLAPRTPAMLEALSALHRGWSEDTEVRRVLARAARSEDEAVRAAASGSVEP